MTKQTILMVCCGVMGALLATATQAEDGEDNPVWKSSKFGIFTHHAWGGNARKLTLHPDLSVPTVSSPRAEKSPYVWDPDLNDYKKREDGKETDDLSLSGSGKKSSADYRSISSCPKGPRVAT